MKSKIVLVCLALAAAPVSGLEPLTVSELSGLCSSQLNGGEEAPESRCALYIQGYLAGSSDTHFGTGRKPPSGLVERALQTRVGARISERSDPLYCIPETTSFDQFAHQLVQMSAQVDAQASAEQLMLRVLQSHYRCVPS